MAEYDPQKVSAVLQDYAETLEVLTINSKPLINDLTMAADRYKPLAPQIIEKIESRLFEVSTAFCFVFCFFVYAYLLVSCTACIIVRTAYEAVNRDTIQCFCLQFSFHTRLCPSRGTFVPLCTVMNQKMMKTLKWVLRDVGAKLCAFYFM